MSEVRSGCAVRAAIQAEEAETAACAREALAKMHPDFVKGARCSICGNGGPGSPSARWPCAKAPTDLRSCPFAAPKVQGMSPKDVAFAHAGLKALGELETEIMCIKSKTLQVVFAGHYYGEGFPEVQEAARLGLLKLFYQYRATKIAELRALGVDLAE